jgi:hypothetical protein
LKRLSEDSDLQVSQSARWSLDRLQRTAPPENLE